VVLYRVSTATESTNKTTQQTSLHNRKQDGFLKIFVCFQTVVEENISAPLTIKLDAKFK
jgi:hypothetical protein